MSRNVEFDESASWYSLPAPMSDSDPIPEDEASEPEMIRAEDEEGFGTLDESPISFRLSGLHEQPSRNDQSDDKPTSSGDWALFSPRKELRRRFMHREKGKKKMLEYATGREPVGSERIRLRRERRQTFGSEV